MLIFYLILILILSSILDTVHKSHLMKKYQLLAGTDIEANVIYMIINGAVSALLPAVVLFFSEESFETTPYSLLMALMIVLCASVYILGTMKAYKTGQVAIVNVFSTMGSIIISCVWGGIWLNETITRMRCIVVVIIVVAILLISWKKEEKIEKSILWLLLLIFVFSGLTSVFTKMHQVETRFQIVNTLSFSIWIGIIRIIVFSVFLPFLIQKGNIRKYYSAKAVGCAITASLLGGLCYIVMLALSVVLPITVISPVSTGINVGLAAVLGWKIYREKLKMIQIIGIIMCIGGIVLLTFY